MNINSSPGGWRRPPRWPLGVGWSWVAWRTGSRGCGPSHGRRVLWMPERGSHAELSERGSRRSCASRRPKTTAWVQPERGVLRMPVPRKCCESGQCDYLMSREERGKPLSSRRARIRRAARRPSGAARRPSGAPAPWRKRVPWGARWVRIPLTVQRALGMRCERVPREHVSSGDRGASRRMRVPGRARVSWQARAPWWVRVPWTARQAFKMGAIACPAGSLASAGLLANLGSMASAGPREGMASTRNGALCLRCEHGERGPWSSAASALSHGKSMSHGQRCECGSRWEYGEHRECGFPSEVRCDFTGRLLFYGCLPGCIVGIWPPQPTTALACCTIACIVVVHTLEVVINDNDKVVWKRFLIDGDGAGDYSRINLLVKSFIKWCTSNSQEEGYNQYQRVLSSLSQREFSIGKTLLGYGMNSREMEKLWKKLQRNKMHHCWSTGKKNKHKKSRFLPRCQWLTPVILATQEAEIRRLVVGDQPRWINLENIQHKTGLIEWLTQTKSTLK
jgi:hypothetical protein